MRADTNFSGAIWMVNNGSVMRNVICAQTQASVVVYGWAIMTISGLMLQQEISCLTLGSCHLH